MMQTSAEAASRRLRRQRIAQKIGDAVADLELAMDLITHVGWHHADEEYIEMGRIVDKMLAFNYAKKE